MTTAQFAPNTSMAAGTSLTAAVLNGLVVAQSYLLSGGILPTSASLTATQPATQAVINNGTAALWVSVASGSLTLAASSDVYVDLDNTGAYHQAAVANGATPPAITANSLRLYKAITSGTAITSVTQLAPNVPLAPAGVRQVNATVMSVDTTLVTGVGTVPNMTIAAMVLAGASGNLRFTLTGSGFVLSGSVPNPFFYVLVTGPGGVISTVYLQASPAVNIGASTRIPIQGANVLTGLPPGLYNFTLTSSSGGAGTVKIDAASVPSTDGLTLMIEEYA